MQALFLYFSLHKIVFEENMYGYAKEIDHLQIDQFVCKNSPIVISLGRSRFLSSKYFLNFGTIAIINFIVIRLSLRSCNQIREIKYA